MKKNLMLVLASVFIVNVAIIAQDQNLPQGRKGEKKENRVGRGIAPPPSHTTVHALAHGGFLKLVNLL
jgi:hypothetical protein